MAQTTPLLEPVCVVLREVFDRFCIIATRQDPDQDDEEHVRQRMPQSSRSATIGYRLDERSKAVIGVR